MTLLEKWNLHKQIIDDKFTEFVRSINITPPPIFWIVNLNGSVSERKTIGLSYSYQKHDIKLYFNGKTPNRDDVKRIIEYSARIIDFNKDFIWVEYSENWGDGFTAKSRISLENILNKEKTFTSIEDAEAVAVIVRQKVDEDKSFKEAHKKDKNYDYRANGYEFLGWQNGWKHVHFDEDRNPCSETGKPAKTFGFLTADYPKYGKCNELQHKHIEVSHNQRGSENTVSCPICKIYWKYDCSD